MTVNEQKEILEKASEEMCKSLNSFGTNETLKLLVMFSNQDVIVNELLARFPSIVAIGDFFYKKPVYKIDEKTFQNLVDANPYIWIRKDKNEREEGRRS